MDVPLLSPWGWNGDKYHSNQMILVGHLKAGRNTGLGTWGWAMPTQRGLPVVGEELLSTSVPAAPGEDLREVTPIAPTSQ